MTSTSVWITDTLNVKYWGKGYLLSLKVTESLVASYAISMEILILNPGNTYSWGLGVGFSSNKSACYWQCFDLLHPIGALLTFCANSPLGSPNFRWNLVSWKKLLLRWYLPVSAPLSTSAGLWQGTASATATVSQIYSKTFFVCLYKKDKSFWNVHLKLFLGT